MLKSEEFIGWVQDRSSSDFARSKEYKGLVDAIPSEVFNNIVHPFLQQVEEIGGAPELTGAILLFPAMCVDDWALNSAEEYFEMLQYALGTAQQMWSNMSPWSDILFVLVVAATLAVLVGATVWGVKHSE